ncbi:MAG: hypothetical protein L6R41_000336 [Letrouitia leprolyta]|nr:MAG: hypothetical protein L6R41_000336 [Letrouitia leprolyta]
MPRNRPQLSITLPRNFTFHYTESEEPKTPEQENATPATAPSPPHAYRIKRRVRPTIQTSTEAQARLTQQLQDAPVPTIAAPFDMDPKSDSPAVEHHAAEPTEYYLAPTAIRPFTTLPRPRTPTIQRIQLSEYMRATPPPSDLGDTIIRPLSRCSITSDSSNESSGSLTSYPSLGGSCTSPESDPTDPFVLPSMRKSKMGLKPNSLAMTEISRQTPSSNILKHSPVYWTPDMDKHLWSTYMLYVQDPTVTPFKTLPGSVPPLGVCHRVARLARRTWRGAGQVLQSPTSDKTINAAGLRSSGATPVLTTPTWPKSRSSTRRRLRFLAKRKPSIAPHYQRLLRSPSPFSSSSQARSARASSPLCQEQTLFDTRDIQFSLSTSTAATMQPNGPLAQLSQGNSVGPQQQSEPINDSPVPWASPPAVPSSDLNNETRFSDVSHDLSAEAPQLGSPFTGSRTWGPSRSRQHLRPFTPRAQSSQQASTIGPALKSPVRFSSRNPYPSINKRRAQHQLEDELSPGGSDKHELIEHLFGGHTEGRHRRVRSRGFSLGDVRGDDCLESLFQQHGPEQQNSQPPSESAQTSSLQPPQSGEPIRRLGSPFSISGSGSMPTRRPSRHLASASLSAFDANNFTSIDQRIRQTDLPDDFLKRLRE